MASDNNNDVHEEAKLKTLEVISNDANAGGESQGSSLSPCSSFADEDGGGSDGTYRPDHSGERQEMKNLRKKMNDVIDFLASSLAQKGVNCHGADARRNSFFQSHVDMLEVEGAYKKKSSKTAKNLLKAATHLNNCLSLLSKVGSIHEVVEELSLAFRYEGELLYFPGDSCRMLQNIILKLLKENRNDDDSPPSEFDKDLKICYCYLDIDQSKHILEYVEQCIQKYPMELSFRMYYYKMCEVFGQYFPGISDCTLAGKLKVYEKNFEIAAKVAQLYIKLAETEASEGATHPVMMEYRTEVITLLQQYLHLAPEDHRYRATAYYDLALQHYYIYKEKKVAKSTNQQKNNFHLMKIREFYKNGVEAEKKLLSCFTFSIPQRVVLETFLDGVDVGTSLQ